MNILITLPKDLLEKIISGEKEFEMRKCLPKHMKIGEDGFFVVEKAQTMFGAGAGLMKLGKPTSTTIAQDGLPLVFVFQKNT